MHPFCVIVAGDCCVSNLNLLKSPCRYTTTFFSAPFFPTIASWLVAGVECSLAQEGSAAMLIVFILGAAPSNCTLPETLPAVAASTGTPVIVPAGAEVSFVDCLFPQPASGKSRKPEKAAKHTNLHFMRSTSYRMCLDRDECAGIVELIQSGARILHKEMARVHLNRSIGKQGHLAAVHGPRRGPCEIHALGVVFTAMAWAMKHVLLRQPVRSASEVRASSENHEQASRLEDNPKAVGLQKTLIDSLLKTGGESDVHDGIGFVEHP